MPQIIIPNIRLIGPLGVYSKAKEFGCPFTTVILLPAGTFYAFNEYVAHLIGQDRSMKPEQTCSIVKLDKRCEFALTAV